MRILHYRLFLLPPHTRQILMLGENYEFTCMVVYYFDVDLHHFSYDNGSLNAQAL